MTESNSTTEAAPQATRHDLLAHEIAEQWLGSRRAAGETVPAEETAATHDLARFVVQAVVAVMVDAVLHGHPVRDLVDDLAASAAEAQPLAAE